MSVQLWGNGSVILPSRTYEVGMTPEVRSNVSGGKLVLGGCDPGPPGGADLVSVRCDKEPVMGLFGDQPCLCKGQKHTGSSGSVQQTGLPSLPPED